MATNPTIERPLVGRRRAGRLAPYRRERQEFGGRIQWEPETAQDGETRPVVWP